MRPRARDGGAGGLDPDAVRWGTAPVPAVPAIFVAIASYTDPALPRTLRNASAMARKPDALRFGICWHADPAAPVPLDPFVSPSRDP